MRISTVVALTCFGLSFCSPAWGSLPNQLINIYITMHGLTAPSPPSGCAAYSNPPPPRFSMHMAGIGPTCSVAGAQSTCQFTMRQTLFSTTQRTLTLTVTPQAKVSAKRPATRAGTTKNAYKLCGDPLNISSLNIGRENTLTDGPATLNTNVHWLYSVIGGTGGYNAACKKCMDDRIGKYGNAAVVNYYAHQRCDYTVNFDYSRYQSEVDAYTRSHGCRPHQIINFCTVKYYESFPVYTFNLPTMYKQGQIPNPGANCPTGYDADSSSSTNKTYQFNVFNDYPHVGTSVSRLMNSSTTPTSQAICNALVAPSVSGDTLSSQITMQLKRSCNASKIVSAIGAGHSIFGSKSSELGGLFMLGVVNAHIDCTYDAQSGQISACTVTATSTQG